MTIWQTSPNILALIEKLGSKPTAKNDEALSDPGSIDSSLRTTILTLINLSTLTSPSVLVQGRTMFKVAPLFLILDGAGSAAACIHLPRGLVPATGPRRNGGESRLSRHESSKSMPDRVQPTMELVEEARLVMGRARAGQIASNVSNVPKQQLQPTGKTQMAHKTHCRGFFPPQARSHVSSFPGEKGTRKRATERRERARARDGAREFSLLRRHRGGPEHWARVLVSMLRGSITDLMVGTNLMETTVSHAVVGDHFSYRYTVRRE